ncbi:hypothetical protein E2C01_059715 [Portunus trituberculatus]|uniref:Uncharacterized protein n=1 Tax=Portunus trituberculatus TaxID=210409 RepID=A0A5B7H8J7_PORTR|nr:hypothetical protein [Portunus trituberculatus]
MWGLIRRGTYVNVKLVSTCGVMGQPVDSDDCGQRYIMLCVNHCHPTVNYDCVVETLDLLQRRHEERNLYEGLPGGEVQCMKEGLEPKLGAVLQKGL